MGISSRTAILCLAVAACLAFAHTATAVALGSGPELQSADGETCFFFIPQTSGDVDVAYVFDTKLNRLLVCPSGEDSPSVHSPEGSDPVEWIVLPGEVRAYASPSFGSSRPDVVLRYPREVTTRSRLERESGVEWISFDLGGNRLFLPAVLAVMKVEYPPGTGDLPIGHERVSRDVPLPLEYRPSDLVQVDGRWNFHGADYPKYLRREAARAVEGMLSRAEREGISIRIFSAFRSSERQRYLYLRQIEKSGLDQKTVAKPGHSEHQLGTAVDLCGLDPKSVASATFDRTREGKWLGSNARAHGFLMSYTVENSAVSGYLPEPWHYRYVGTRR